MSEHSFDPEVVALLQSIARDPGASLLRIPKERLLRYVGAPEDMLSPHGSYLTKAEKHLMTAYREQAAKVLLEACILRLKEDPQFWSPVMPDGRALRSRAVAVVRRLPANDRASGVLGGIAADKASPAATLAATSMRLAPSVAGSTALAVSHIRDGHVKASIRVSETILKSRPPARQAAQALENLAGAYVKLEDFESAFEFNYRASVADAQVIRFVVWCLTTSLQGGQESKALESARRLDAMEMGVDAALQALRASKAQGAWTPTNSAMQLIPRIRGRLHERSEAICAAFS